MALLAQHSAPLVGSHDFGSPKLVSHRKSSSIALGYRWSTVNSWAWLCVCCVHTSALTHPCCSRGAALGLRCPGAVEWHQGNPVCPPHPADALRQSTQLLVCMPCVRQTSGVAHLSPSRPLSTFPMSYLTQLDSCGVRLPSQPFLLGVHARLGYWPQGEIAP